jgi:hypothetical protein
MKKLWFITLFLIFIFNVDAQSKKAKAKADKTTTVNLQEHIQYLASDKLEGRRAGSPGEVLAMEYIIGMFKKYKLSPKGDSGFRQEFEIIEGLAFNSPDNFFSVNDQKLEPKVDYYPLSFSANKGAKGSVSPLLREEKEIWFWNVADVLDDNKNNPHFDMLDAVKEEAQKAAAKTANALIVYNSSPDADNILFNKKDTAGAVDIPVIYITKDGMQKYFSDPTNIYDLDLNVHLAADNRKAHNVIGYLNFNAPRTIVLEHIMTTWVMGKMGTAWMEQDKFITGQMIMPVVQAP